MRHRVLLLGVLHALAAAPAGAQIEHMRQVIFGMD